PIFGYSNQSPQLVYFYPVLMDSRHGSSGAIICIVAEVLAYCRLAIAKGRSQEAEGRRQENLYSCQTLLSPFLKVPVRVLLVSYC
ncbi:MAG TPA: hypothetical protein V6D50_03950, partial [Chroococcales cyanobacterium]